MSTLSDVQGNSNEAHTAAVSYHMLVQTRRKSTPRAAFRMASRKCLAKTVFAMILGYGSGLVACTWWSTGDARLAGFVALLCWRKSPAVVP